MNGGTKAWCVVAMCILIAGCGERSIPTGSVEQRTRSDNKSAAGRAESQARGSLRSADVATPAPRNSPRLPAQSAELGVYDTNDGEAVEIKPGSSVAGSFSAPADGRVRVLHVTVGNTAALRTGSWRPRFVSTRRALSHGIAWRVRLTMRISRSSSVSRSWLSWGQRLRIRSLAFPARRPLLSGRTDGARKAG